MKRLVLICILQLGRYAVLPVVGLAGGLLVIWLMLLDDSTRIALSACHTASCRP
ncbi:hypothetical protein ACQR10_15275 [Bradyrhizobium sp. HKCCYLRH2060]|uniref:hypothetical protein n=1 Tax=Bradyrhizobium TaxID=374 RepID=UPI0028E444FB|nr:MULTISPECIES: hypothetical protein [unclassified Bradyrhizobium]